MKLETLRTRLCAYKPDVGWLSLFLHIEERRGPAVAGWGRLSVSPGQFGGGKGLDAFAELVIKAVTTDFGRAEVWRDVLLARAQLRGPPQQAHAGLQAWLLSIPPHPDPAWRGPLGSRVEPIPPAALDALAVPTSPLELALLVERATASLATADAMVAVIRWATRLPEPWFQLCVARILPESRQLGLMGKVALALQSDPTFRRATKRFQRVIRM